MSHSIESMDADKLGFAFNNISVSTLFPPKPILSNISGFVKKGGITAVFGASSSGKSLFLQACAARVQGMNTTGEMYIDGSPINPTDIHNSISYVSQFDMLIGDLTARESITTSAALKIKKSPAEIKKVVDAVLTSFGIDHVADTYIGTIFRAGLSGGQKRRVEVAIEMVAPPAVLLLDEPTSGLDGSIAFDVLKGIRETVLASGDKLSVALAIHQPNSRILELFDHVLVLGEGNMTFFGTVQESITHFTVLGAPPPHRYTPTDFYLQITDTNFTTDKKFDFEGAYVSSKFYFQLMDLLEQVKTNGTAHKLSRMLGAVEEDSDSEGSVTPTGNAAASTSTDMQKVIPAGVPLSVSAKEEQTDQLLGVKKPTSFATQYKQLLHREILIAQRDYTLYYLQFALVTIYGVLMGAVFFGLHYKIDGTMGYVPGGLLWLCLAMIYMQTFKTYHLCKANDRFKHEYANNSYSALAYWCAELTISIAGIATYMPGAAAAYFMMGYPASGFPFALLLLWSTAVTAESMLGMTCKFFSDTSAAVVTNQLLFVILTAFGGGLFIRWDSVPNYWDWLQVISIFTWSTRALNVHVIRKLTYECVLQGGVCYGPQGETYSCQSTYNGGTMCDVSGGEVMFVTQGIKGPESPWRSYLYLMILFAAFRLCSLVLMYFPPEKLSFIICSWYRMPEISMAILEANLKVRRLEGQVGQLIHCYVYRASTPETNEDEASSLIPASEKLTCSAGYKQRCGKPDVKHDSTSRPASTSGVQMQQKTASLVWKNLTLKLKNTNKVLVDNVSGSVETGRVLALMGPSGAGKTTLLNALANRAPYGEITGEITYANRKFIASDLMFVPQFDELKPDSTVMEQIMYVGMMKCEDVTAMKLRLVKLLQILGLFNKANTKCKDLSGGELKRVSVGMGMISDPKVLFLDEPTSGLDSTAAYFLVNFLVSLARNTNVAVIMTIHQPAAIVFDMLQDLYLLESGRLAFFGPISAAEPYFNDYGLVCPDGVNAADYYLEQVYKKPTFDPKYELWRDVYYSSALGKEMNSKIENLHITSAGAADLPSAQPTSMERFEIMLGFYFNYFWEAPGYYRYRFVYLILCAFFIGTLFWDLKTNTSDLTLYSGSIFFSIWATLFAAVGGTGLVASDRRQAFEQIKNGIMTPGIYCVAQFLATVPYNIICGIIFQSIFHWCVNINPKAEVFIYAIVLTAEHLLLMESIMMIVVEIVKDAMLSVTLAMVVMGTLFLFPGFFIKVNDMPAWIGWMSYIMPTKYSFDGYIHMVFASQTFDVQNFGFTMSGNTILKDVFDNKNVDGWGMVGVLVAYILLFRIIHYFLFYSASKPFLAKVDAAPAVKDASGEEKKLDKIVEMV